MARREVIQLPSIVPHEAACCKQFSAILVTRATKSKCPSHQTYESICFYIPQYISENKKNLKPPTSDALKKT